MELMEPMSLLVLLFMVVFVFVFVFIDESMLLSLEEDKKKEEDETASVGSTSGASNGCEGGHNMPSIPSPSFKPNDASRVLKDCIDSALLINASISIHGEKKDTSLLVLVLLLLSSSASSSSSSSPITKAFKVFLDSSMTCFISVKSFIIDIFNKVILAIPDVVAVEDVEDPPSSFLSSFSTC